MKKIICLFGCLAAATSLSLAEDVFSLGEAPPKVPRFSVLNMDRSVVPGNDFYHFADGTWLKENPVPEDKSRWAGFDELQQRNWFLIHDLLEKAAHNTTAASNSPEREVGDFYASATDTNLINALGVIPIEGDFAQIAALRNPPTNSCAKWPNFNCAT